MVSISIKVLGSSSYGNCYLIDDGNTTLMLDCGLTWFDIQKALNYKTSHIAGCLISHRHRDHSRSASKLIQYGIDVYCNKETADSIETLKKHRIHVLEPMTPFQIGTWNGVAWPLEHDVPNLGFYLASGARERLAYITDTPRLEKLPVDLSYLIIECNYSSDVILNSSVDSDLKRRIIKNHMSLETLLKLLKAIDTSKMKEIHLIHLSITNSDEEMFRRKVEELTGIPTYIARQKVPGYITNKLIGGDDIGY